MPPGGHRRPLGQRLRLRGGEHLRPHGKRWPGSRKTKASEPFDPVPLLESGEILRLRRPALATRKTALIAERAAARLRRVRPAGQPLRQLPDRGGHSVPATGSRAVLFNSPDYGFVHFGSARAGSVLVHIPPLYAVAGDRGDRRAHPPAGAGSGRGGPGPDRRRSPERGSHGHGRRKSGFRGCARRGVRPTAGPGHRPRVAGRHDLHGRHHRAAEGSGGQPHRALRLGSQHRPRTPDRGAGRRRGGGPHVPRRGPDDLVPGRDPPRLHRGHPPQVGPGGVHRGHRAPPDLLGVPGAGPGARPAPLAGLRPEAAELR